jgi:hypothetical protein
MGTDIKKAIEIKEVISFRLKLVNLIKSRYPGIRIPRTKEGHTSDMIIIEGTEHQRQRTESVFTTYHRLRPFLRIDAANLVKYLDSSAPALKRAIAQVLLAEGDKKFRRLLPVYIRLLPWYLDKTEKKYEQMKADQEAQRVMEEAYIPESFKQQVRRQVIDKYVSKGLTIPDMWRNNEVYSVDHLLERFNKGYED